MSLYSFLCSVYLASLVDVGKVRGSGKQERFFRDELPVAEIDSPAKLHLNSQVLRQGHTQVDWSFVQVDQVQIDALMELAAVEGEVELARRIEEHHLIVGVEEQVDVLTGVPAGRAERGRVHTEVSISEHVSVTVRAKVASVPSIDHRAATDWIALVSSC